MLQHYFQTYLAAFSQFATFSGRARRSEFWPFYIINLLIVLLLQGAAYLVFASSLPNNVATAIGIGITFLIYTLIVFLPALGLDVRRLHDAGFSGWFVLLIFVPYIGGITVIVLQLLDSQPKPNKWGPDPKGRS